MGKKRKSQPVTFTAVPAGGGGESKKKKQQQQQQQQQQQIHHGSTTIANPAPPSTPAGPQTSGGLSALDAALRLVDGDPLALLVAPEVSFYIELYKPVPRPATLSNPNAPSYPETPNPLTPQGPRRLPHRHVGAAPARLQGHARARRLLPRAAFASPLPRPGPPTGGVEERPLSVRLGCERGAVSAGAAGNPDGGGAWVDRSIDRIDPVGPTPSTRDFFTQWICLNTLRRRTRRRWRHCTASTGARSKSSSRSAGKRSAGASWRRSRPRRAASSVRPCVRVCAWVSFCA